MLHRALRAQLLAVLLLVAQVASLVVVPLHAIAHASGKVPAVSATARAAPLDSAISLSRLFGHDQGFACDDWSAAFALDSHSGNGAPVVGTVAPQTCRIESVATADVPTARSGPFRARAPPRN